MAATSTRWAFPLIAGKTFDRLELQRGDEVIISRATAIQFWKDSTGQRVLGKRFRELPGTPWLTIVGVVGDTRDSSLASPPSLVVYRPQSVGGSNNRPTQWTMALVVRTASEPAAITSAVQRAVRDLDPTLPLFDIRSMSDITAASMAQLSFTIIVLGAAALVTLILGAVGLYGVMAYVVSLRTRELAVRIALGATPSAVIRMLTTQGVAVTGIRRRGRARAVRDRGARAQVAAVRGGVDRSGDAAQRVAPARGHCGGRELAAGAADRASRPGGRAALGVEADCARMMHH